VRHYVASARAAASTDFITTPHRVRTWVVNSNNHPARDISRLMGPLNVRKGDRVADVGCGSGYCVMAMSPMVGPTGRVWAVDIDAEAIEFIRLHARALGLTNVEALVSIPTDAKLPANSVNRILVANVMHMFLDSGNENDEKTFRTVTEPFCKSLHRALEPGGLLLVQDFTKSQFGPMGVSEPALLRAFTRCGFRLLKRFGVQQDYELLFTRQG